MTSHLMFCLFMVHLNKETLLAFCVECLFEGLNWNTVGFFFFFFGQVNVGAINLLVPWSVWFSQCEAYLCMVMSHITCVFGLCGF